MFNKELKDITLDDLHGAWKGKNTMTDAVCGLDIHRDERFVFNDNKNSGNNFQGVFSFEFDKTGNEIKLIPSGGQEAVILSSLGHTSMGARINIHPHFFDKVLANPMIVDAEK